MRVGIIGAGIAGLSLATRLVRAGHSVLVLDKGRSGVGGRASTRIWDRVTFDHGCQYFTVRDPKFRAFLRDHVPAGAWGPWQGRFATFRHGRLEEEFPTEPRYVGIPRMNEIARSVAAGIECRTATEVIRVGGSPGHWVLVDLGQNEHGPFDWLVSTAPPAQTSQLLRGASVISSEAKRVEMGPCFALMIEPSTSLSLPFDHIQCDHPIVGSASNNHSKPGRNPSAALVIHSNQTWARDHVYDELPTIGWALREAVGQSFGIDLGPVASESVHRWLYARPLRPLGRPYLIDRLARVAACGDWCLAPRLEHAFLSGDACADAILGR